MYPTIHTCFHPATCPTTGVALPGGHIVASLIGPQAFPGYWLAVSSNTAAAHQLAAARAVRVWLQVTEQWAPAHQYTSAAMGADAVQWLHVPLHGGLEVFTLEPAEVLH